MFYPPFRFHVAQMIPIHHANATLLPICPESGHPPRELNKAMLPGRGGPWWEISWPIDPKAFCQTIISCVALWSGFPNIVSNTWLQHPSWNHVPHTDQITDPTNPTSQKFLLIWSSGRFDSEITSYRHKCTHCQQQLVTKPFAKQKCWPVVYDVALVFSHFLT